jgi:kinesin family protein 5
MSCSDEIVKVLVRFRPLLESELSCSPLTCVDLADNKVTIFPPNSNSLTFVYDKVLSSLSSQEEVYNSGPSSVVTSAMQGFNGTILTYGQAFSGKTFTMFGDPEDNEKKGVIPRMISTIFEFIDKAAENIEFLIKVSFFELFNEKIFDLLNPLGTNLKIKNQKKGVVIEGLREVYTPSDFDIQELIKVGIVNKQSREASGLTKSALSHTFFVLSVEQNSNESGFNVGKLSLVDLAGAEKPSSFDKSDQMKSINSSLSNLAIVINALTEKTSVYVPYRASKLTRILEESLGGNSKTTLIVTCSASPLSQEETLSSLRFALRVKS